MANREITITTKDLLSVQEAATILNHPRITIYRWITGGKLISIKFGGIYYVPAIEVERLKNQEV